MSPRARQLIVAVFGAVAIILVFFTHGRVLTVGLVVAVVLLAAALYVARSREPRVNRGERRSGRRAGT